MVVDPACGTSGFLITSVEYLKEKCKEKIFFNEENKKHYNNDMFSGFDIDRTMLRIGAMNTMTYGIENSFKDSLDADIVSPDLLKVCSTKKTELLFLILFLRMLKVGGRCACIVPDGVLFGSSNANRK